MGISSYGRVAVLSAVLLMGCASWGNAAGTVTVQSGSSASTRAGTEAIPSCDPTQALGCDAYTSISGKGAELTDLPWITAQPLKIIISTMNGSTTLVMGTPCNTLNVPVTVTDNLITPDPGGIAAGTEGCIGAASEHEAWARQFLSHPITYSHAGDACTFKNAVGTIEFRKSAKSG